MIYLNDSLKFEDSVEHKTPGKNEYANKMRDSVQSNEQSVDLQSLHSTASDYAKV